MGRKRKIIDTSKMGLAEKLRYANRKPMAQVLEAQRLDPHMPAMDFEERLTPYIDAEIDVMNTRTMNRLIKQGGFPFPSAHMDGIVNYAGRPLNWPLLLDLATCDYIEDGKGVILSGPTGSGKTYIACALAICACQQGLRALYLRTPEFLEKLMLAQEQHNLAEHIKFFARYDLLVMDEWLTRPVKADQIYLLMDFLDYCCGREEKQSIIFCTHFEVKDWYQRLVQSGTETAGGESALDRIVHNCYRIPVCSDQSMRKVLSTLEQQEN